MTDKAHRRAATAALIALLASFGWTGNAHAAQALAVRVTEGSMALPTNIQVTRSDQALEVSGQVIKRPANASRRLYGRVRLEILDSHGRTLVTRETRPRRVDLGRHTYRGRFDFTLEAVPERAAVLEIGYH